MASVRRGFPRSRCVLRPRLLTLARLRWRKYPMRSSEALRLVFSTFTPEFRAQDVVYDRSACHTHSSLFTNYVITAPFLRRGTQCICYSHKSVYGLVILGSSLRPDRERIELLESTVCDRTAFVLVTEQAEVMSRVCTHRFYLFISKLARQ